MNRWIACAARGRDDRDAATRRSHRLTVDDDPHGADRRELAHLVVAHLLLRHEARVVVLHAVACERRAVVCCNDRAHLIERQHAAPLS